MKVLYENNGFKVTTNDQEEVFVEKEGVKLRVSAGYYTHCPLVVTTDNVNIFEPLSFNGARAIGIQKR